MAMVTMTIIPPMAVPVAIAAPIAPAIVVVPPVDRRVDGSGHDNYRRRRRCHVFHGRVVGRRRHDYARDAIGHPWDAYRNTDADVGQSGRGTHHCEYRGAGQQTSFHDSPVVGFDGFIVARFREAVVKHPHEKASKRNVRYCFSRLVYF
jgi:hypothetical protein